MLLAPSGPVLAESNGIAGYSGNPARNAGGTCASCHGGGSFSISTTISGATAVAPGSSTAYTISATGSATRFGFNASASGGTLSAGSNSRSTTTGSPDFDQFAGEVTHASPQVSSTFGFSFNAPSSVGAVTLYGCINPVNLADSSSGDGPPDCDTQTVTVNTAPNADNDALTVLEDSGSTCVNVTTGDTSGSSGNESGDFLDVFSVTAPNQGGSAVIGGSPCSSNQVRYQPASNFNGTETFNYTLRDSFDSVTFDDTGTVTVTVTAVNDAPVAVANTVGAIEDSPMTFSSLESNDTDVDGDTLFINDVTQGNGNGTVSIVAGNVEYVPTANFCNTKTFSYQVRDRATAGTGQTSGFATVTVNVACLADSPIAENDALSVPRGSVDQVLAALANDSDPDNLSGPADAGVDITAVSIVSAAMAGESASVTAGNKSVTYTPPANFSGSRLLAYTISDGTLTDTAQITVTVQTGAPPVAVQDGPFNVVEDSLASTPANIFGVLGNDTDADGDTLSVSVTAFPVNGTLTGDGGTMLTYVPNANFAGNDSFSYRAQDSGTLLSNVIVVPIVVAPVQDAPVATDDTLAVARGSTSNLLDSLLNDTDVDNQAGAANMGLTVTAVTVRAGQPVVTGESAVVASAGAGVRYTPPTDFSGTRLLDYTISDGTASASAQISVTVLAGAAPVAAQDGPFTVDEDSLAAGLPNMFTVLANDTDADGDTLSISVSAPPTNGTLTGDGGSGALTYQPNADFAGGDSFRYRARDSATFLSNEITVQVTITPVPDAPVAINDSVSVARGSSANALGVLGNDTDVDNLTGPANAGLMVSAVSVQAGQPAVVGEQAVVSAGNSGVTYTPPRNFSGTRTLNYTITDGAASASAQIVVTVLEGAVPVAGQDGPFTVNEDSLASDLTNSFNVLANDTDPDLDTLSISVTAAPTNGLLSGDNGTLLTYQPNPNYAGSDSFRYRARDSDGLLSSEIIVSIVVTPQADAPAAAIDSYPVAPLIFREDQGPFDLDVLANDADLDQGDTRQVISVLQGDRGGSVAVMGAGTGNAVRYTPATNFNGTEGFSYTIQDSAGLLDSATVSVEISPVNDAPGITSTAVVVAQDAQAYRYQVAQSDVDDSAFTYALSGAPTTGTPMSVSASGLITWTPPISASLAAYTVGPISVTVTDAGGGQGVNLSATQTFSITVNAPDGDGDGMPDSYENANGFDAANAADGAQDRDGDGRSNADEYTQGRNPGADDVPPVIVSPADLQVVSTGFLTAPDLGAATASDVRDGAVAVQGPVPAGPFRPGRYTLTYGARDAANNTTSVTQRLDVLPRIELGPDQISGEGGAIGVAVVLNGTAPSYPVAVDYIVGGTAGSADHDANSGRVVVSSGTGSVIPINIAADGTGEGDESIVITLTAVDGGVLGSRVAQTTTILERNVAPRASLTTTQFGEPRTQVFANQGPVTLAAEAVDPNAGDLVSFDFSGTDAALGAPAGDVRGFSFDPAGVAPGSYLVRLTARDMAGSASTVETRLILRASAPALTSQDSDGDGIADNVEGVGDADADGAPDYLDRFPERFVLADQAGQPATTRLVEAESGVSLRLGPTAIAAGRSGALVSPADVVALGGGAGPMGNGVDSFENVGGLFDFEMIGLAPGASASIVLPLQAGLRPGSVWRKYASGSGWHDFVVDSANRLASAASVGGQCPAPSTTAYIEGLTSLHNCVRLTLQDGGPNDADGEANGRVRDPGGAAVAAAEDPEPPPSGKSGGGGSIGLGLLIGLWALAFASGIGYWRRSA